MFSLLLTMLQGASLYTFVVHVPEVPRRRISASEALDAHCQVALQKDRSSFHSSLIVPERRGPCTTAFGVTMFLYLRLSSYKVLSQGQLWMHFLSY